MDLFTYTKKIPNIKLHFCDMVKHESQVTSYELRVTSY